jgi:hypothetical protein
VSRNRYKTESLVSDDQFVMKTPGCLLSGFGQEDIHDVFHSGTIFQDASSGII